MNQYFGPAWNDDLPRVPAPSEGICIWCGEGFADGDSGMIYVPGLPEMAHFECNIRQVVGSADCQTRGPHTPASCVPVREGQTKRQAAREAVEVFMRRSGDVR